MNLQIGMNVMLNGVAYKLVFLADSVGDIDYWWAETTFVEYPETKMCQFNRHVQYQELHTRRHYASRH